MIDEPKQYVDFLTRNGITANQFLICYLLYCDDKIKINQQYHYPDKGKDVDDEGEKHPIALMFQYKYNVGWNKDEINDLVEKEFLINKNRNDKDGQQQMCPEFFEVTGKFVDEIFAHPNDFEEFWENYPTYVQNFTNPNGPKINLRVADKDEVEKLFNKKIKTKSAAKRIISVTKKAAKRGLINMNINKYLGSEAWKELDKQLKETSDPEKSYGLQQY